MGRYLYIEKEQRIATENKLSRRAIRISEELEEMGVDFDVKHFPDISITITSNGINIHVDKKNILSYSHIIFGGHHLHSNGYEIKKLIIDLVDQWNKENPDKKILLQNRRFYKKMPFYSKMYMGKMCVDNDLPHLLTFYSYAGNYRNNRGPIDYPLVVKHLQGENDLVPIDGKLKIKKNVFLANDEDGWEQERLAEKDLSDFFIQEYAQIDRDIRLFAAKGEVIGGFERFSPEDNFITVAKGAKYKYYNNPSEDLVELVSKASQAWDVDFMALDFIYVGDKPYILEFSMNPGFWGYETKPEGDEPTNIAHYIVRAFEE